MVSHEQDLLREYAHEVIRLHDGPSSIER